MKAVLALLIAVATALAAASASDQDLGFASLEDIYGDSGANFQGALGFFTQEGTFSAQPVPSFGAAVDDMVIEWREFRLDKDTTNCGGPGDTQCADVELATTNFFEGSSLVTITVTDKYPYDPVHTVNDCNGNGVYTDLGDTQDCNGNGIRDVTAKAISDQEPAGEIVVLDEIAPGTSVFRANLPISTLYNAKGVLFLARAGVEAPVVRVQYSDRSANAAGDPCRNDPDPARQGLVETSTQVFISAGRIALAGFRQQDNGDNDGWADTNETVHLWLSFTNKSGFDVDDLAASLDAADDATRQRIDCIGVPTAKVGFLANKASAETQTPFVFHVASTANRVGVNDDFRARFTVTLRSNKFDVLTRTMSFAIELDLSSTSAQTTVGYREDFEVASISATTFTSMSLDLNKASSTLSNGYRCQYNDPLGPNPNAANRASCFLGFTNAASNAYDWHIHSGGASDNSVTRAYTGTKSLHWGVHPTAGAKRDTTRLSQLDAIRTTLAVSLPYGASASPELTFKHQVSLMDGRRTGTPLGQSADRAVVAIQLADSGGVGYGNWIKLVPYENEYDAQGTDQFANCAFDPIDDGNDEDSYFDPADPNRRLGPSSTCMPEFVFGWGGDTDYRNAPGKLDQIGRAFDGPGLKGSVDRGTWVQPRFSLNEYKGRRLRFRFLATSLEVSTSVTYNDNSIGGDNVTADDGWYIDDVRIDSAISPPATLSIDTNANAGLPGCVACSSVTAALTSNLTSPPDTSSAPGQPLLLTASATIDRCNNGIPQYQFWIDANGNGVVGDAGDTLLRDWTDNAKFSDAPIRDTRFAVAARCSSDPACSSLPASSATAIRPITVTCPGAGTPVIGFVGSIGWPDKSKISWLPSQQVDAVRGDLILLHGNGGDFTPTVLACAANDVTGVALSAPETPATGGGFYWLLRPISYCNQTFSYSTGAASEAAGRDTGIAASAQACP